MFKFLCLTLIIFTLSACNPAPSPPLQPTSPPLQSTSPPPQPTSPPPQPTPLVSEVDPEEYALFSAMIDQNVVGYKSEELVVIFEQTNPDIDNLEFALERPFDLPEDLVQAYRLRNEQSYTLSPDFTLNQTYKLMSQSDHDDFLRTNSDSMANFEAKYPQAGGFFIFSRVGMNAARDEALVSISYLCGSLCAEGGVFWMVKEDGVWTVKEEVMSWMA